MQRTRPGWNGASPLISAAIAFVLVSCSGQTGLELPPVRGTVPPCPDQEPIAFVGGESLECWGYPRPNHEGITVELDIGAAGSLAGAGTLAPLRPSIDACVQRAVRTWQYVPARTCEGLAAGRTIRRSFYTMSGL
jgi:hypothetical protein